MSNPTPVPTPKDAIRLELERIEEDCIHSGKSHFNAHERWSRFHYWLGIPSVILSSIAGLAFLRNTHLRFGRYLLKGEAECLGTTPEISDDAAAIALLILGRAEIMIRHAVA